MSELTNRGISFKFQGSPGIKSATPALFEQFILAEDKLDTYEKFWLVWALFFDKMVALCKDGDGYWYVEKIIKSYLFAQTPWKETATDWHTFKDIDGRFFADIAKSIGDCPSTLYARNFSLVTGNILKKQVKIAEWTLSSRNYPKSVTKTAHR